MNGAFPSMPLSYTATMFGWFRLEGQTLRERAAATGIGSQYDVARDGRFLINTVLDEAVAPITLLMNWQADAKK